MHDKPNQDELPPASKADEIPEATKPVDVIADNDPEVDLAVEDIVKKEGNEILEAEDAALTTAFDKKTATFKEKVKHVLAIWWDNKKLRYSTLGALSVLLIVLISIPMTRDYILNNLGARGSISVTVLDDTTQLPLKNVNVTLENQSGQTDDKGTVKIEHLKLGTRTLIINKIAFAPITRVVSIGWGNNALGNLSLKGVGSQYTLNITDYLSGKPIIKAEALTASQSSAFSDPNGKIILTLNNPNTPTIPIIISSNNYRTMNINVTVNATTPTNVQLVPFGKNIFVSNASGHYDVYKIDIDGQNKELLLAGTGNENNNITLAVSPDRQEAALISTRDNVHDASGYLLYTLTFINVRNGTTLTTDHAERIQAIDWIGTKFVYEEIVAGASAANPQRSRIISYDYLINTRAQLATANQFDTTTTAQGNVYYAVSATDPSIAPSLYKIDPTGSNRQLIFGQQVWTLLRTDYNTLELQTPSGWYKYSLGSLQPVSTSAPANIQNYNFITGPDNSKSVWIDYRDGKGVLLLHDIATNIDTIVQTQSGLSLPVAWLSDSVIIYRISTPQETADYAFSTVGGQPHKVSDVVASYSAGPGY